MPIDHYSLCKATAERFVKESYIVVYEYQSFASFEFPDVLRYKNGTTVLYEIKVSRSDFLADAKKDSRRKWRPKVGLYSVSAAMVEKKRNREYLKLRAENPELFYIEAPHLGRNRYYVCPWGMIQPEEVKNGFGLYWYREKDGKFFKKKGSEKFSRNIHAELSIITHAFRKYAHEGPGVNVLIGD